MKPINTSTFDFPDLIKRGFADDLRPVYYVGVNYSPRKNLRTVNDVKCEKVEVEG